VLLRGKVFHRGRPLERMFGDRNFSNALALSSNVFRTPGRSKCGGRTLVKIVWTDGEVLPYRQAILDGRHPSGIFDRKPGVFLLPETSGRGLQTDRGGERLHLRQLCCAVQQDPGRRGSAAPFLDWRSLRQEEIIGMLARHGASIRAAESAVAGHVAVLRERNVSWTRIGAALGISKQAAWERFAGES